MPGNFQLTSGFNVNLNIPTFGEKDKNEENRDKSLSGKYMIVGSRHIINKDQHETIIETASTSSELDAVISNTKDQTEALDTYQ